MDSNLFSPLTRWCEIDLDLLAQNAAQLKKRISSRTKIMAVLKDNAYGHSDVIIGRELESLGIDFFAVSHIDEAIRMRENNIKSDILILGYTAPYNFELLFKYNLTQTLISLQYALKLNDFCKSNNCRIKVHVKIDTGMHRLGIFYDGKKKDISDILEVYNLADLNITGTFTHFSSADSLKIKDISYTENQNKLFAELISVLKSKSINTGVLHAQNSSALLTFSDFEYDYVRVGSLLLGIPYGDIADSPQAKEFKSIFSLKSKVSVVKELPPDADVSYGRNFTTSKPQKTAVVSIGYGDGYPRYLSNRHVHVIVNGYLAEVIGNICMDQLIIDASSVPDIKEGDTVTLIGSSNGHAISIDYIASMMNTLNNEILDHINARVPRVYKKDDDIFIRKVIF
ncbi:MAG: alanine racemase [Clostridium sp.]|nr:alanine racemase [Clostridium sp.]